MQKRYNRNIGFCFFSVNPCELHCRPMNEYFLDKMVDAVIDGTRCYEGSQSRDMCINGICKVSLTFDIQLVIPEKFPVEGLWELSLCSKGLQAEKEMPLFTKLSTLVLSTQFFSPLCIRTIGQW